MRIVCDCGAVAMATAVMPPTVTGPEVARRIRADDAKKSAARSAVADTGIAIEGPVSDPRITERIDLWVMPQGGTWRLACPECGRVLVRVG